MGAVEAIYIFDEHNVQILEHVYTGRPPPPNILLPLYLAHTHPRPPLIFLPNTNPPCLLFSLIHDRLLFFCPTSSEVEPLLVLEFLHRLVDALEEFLGSPLLASKIEASLDVAAQILGEMCDAGVVCNTEPNALREAVEVPNWVGSLLGGFGLPASSPALGQPSLLQRSSSGVGGSSNAGDPGSTGLAIPWRRQNVRHTSNELYVDIVESLSVIMAPSGRPISAMANGSIAFNSKLSGVPDLLLTLTTPSGKLGIQHSMDLPCFHPCVRLAKWRESPGVLSFIPPDGRFVLAGYECNLLPDPFIGLSNPNENSSPSLNLPASIEVNTSLGPNGDELEVRLFIFPRGVLASGMSNNPSSSRGIGNTPFRPSSPAIRTGINVASSNGSVEGVVVTVPISSSVRNVVELRCNKGEAHYSPSEEAIEWRLSDKAASTIGSGGTTMRCTLVGPYDGADAESGTDGVVRQDRFDYDENNGSAPPSSNGAQPSKSAASNEEGNAADSRRVRHLSSLMPRSASLSFSVRGWLASGLRVESLVVNAKTSKGLGAGVTPYKGVKYLTVSQQGVEVRC